MSGGSDRIDGAERPILLRTLFGQKQLDIALICIEAICRCSADPLRVVIHDDGTLQEDAVARINGLECDVEIISRKQADEAIDEILKKFEWCRKFRGQNVLALKLLDVALLEQNLICFCDSDVIALRSFSGLFHSSPRNGSALFMADFRSAYCLTSLRAFAPTGVPFVSRLNTGLFCISKESYDLEFIEWLLAKRYFDFRYHWAEQTVWAALAARLATRFWAPEQVTLVHPKLSYSPEMLLCHFVTPSRGLLEPFRQSRALEVIDSQPTKPGTTHAKRIRGINLAMELMPSYWEYSCFVFRWWLRNLVSKPKPA